MTEAKTGLTKQEMMRIFEEQIELKNAEIERLEAENKKARQRWNEVFNTLFESAIEANERLSDIRKHYEKRPDYMSDPKLYRVGKSIDWMKFGVLCRKWLSELGVLLKKGEG